MAIAVEPDLGRNNKQGRRLALRTDHGYPLEEQKQNAKTAITGRKSNLILSAYKFQ
jgi:hypothetical protein